MTDDEKKIVIDTLTELINECSSMRAFCRLIQEDVADMCRWKTGKTPVTARAAITICRLFNVEPWQLNPVLFPKDLRFIYLASETS